MNQITALKRELRKQADPQRAKGLRRFFKTGPGEYGEGDKFLGLNVQQQRRIAKQHLNLSLKDLEELLQSPYHEERFTALVILIDQYERGDERARQRIYTFYLAHRQQVNSWDLVDTSTPGIIGDYLLTHDRSILPTLIRSASVWDRRIAVLATFPCIAQNNFDDSLKIATQLLSDQHDLIHKAVGWMLREIGKRNENVLRKFLDRHTPSMPRTMLRYAIERLPDNVRTTYLKIPRATY